MIALYSRVSTHEQAVNGHSIDEQQERMRKYCDAMNWRLFKFYTDAGCSGANTDRPALQAMIKDIQDGKISRVVVYKLDRLSRSQKDTLSLIEDSFLANNVDFLSITENFDTSTPFGRAMIGILSVFAQLEREQIKERMGMGKIGRAKKGLYHGGGHVPIGYRYTDGSLQIDPYEAMQIREIHDMFQNGMTYYQINEELHKRGYAHSYGTWAVKTVKHALTNDVYIGTITYDGEKFQGQHEPILDMETFERTQRIIEAKDTSKYVHPARTTYFGGLLFCKKCGGRYVASTTSGNGKKYRYYSCHSRRKVNKNMIKDPNCQNKIYKMDEFDGIIFDEIRKLSTDKSFIHEIKRSRDDTEKTDLIRKELSKIETQKSRFLDLYGLGQFTVEELQGKIAPLQDQKERLETELQEMESCSMTEERAMELISSFDDVLANGSFDQIRLLVHLLIERIEIDGDDIEIRWAFS